MILGFPKAKQGLCHIKHGGAGGFVSIAHSISSLTSIQKFSILFNILREKSVGTGIVVPSPQNVLLD